MKIYWRIIGFARPVKRYTIPYCFYTLFHAIFNMFNFAMIVPILNILFDSEAMAEKVYEMPAFSLSLSYLQDAIRYFLLKTYGESYNLMQVLMFMAVILVVSAFLSNLFRYLGQRTMENMKIMTLQRIRDKVFENVMNLQVGYFNNERKGDIIAKITSDVQVIQYCITSTLQAVFRDPFLIITYMIMLVAMSWQLTIFSALFLPVVAFVIGTIVKRLRRKATAGQEAYADMVSTIEESVSGVKTISAYNDTNYVKGRFYKINSLYSRIIRSMARRQQLASPMSEFLGIAAMAVLLLFGGSLVINGTLSGSVFIAYLAIFSQITRPVRSFADAFTNINQGIAAGERVLPLIDTKSTIVEKEDAKELGEFSDKLEVRDICFAYEGREVICGVSFTINKGETVALVGPSGGGKSTLADLIPRFYDVKSGAIIIDGEDIRDYTLESLRNQIGVVSQDTILFNETIEGNIRMGRRNATFEEIIAAAKVANAHEFIMETEQGYDTNIGDRGMKLSGGQRQRLSIARAVLKNPNILILDEATSALDTESEKMVQEALDILLEGRTSLVIAHRLSTVSSADKIIVIDQGRIVEQGTHEQLMKLEGMYHKLVNMQYVE